MIALGEGVRGGCDAMSSVATTGAGLAARVGAGDMVNGISGSEAEAGLMARGNGDGGEEDMSLCFGLLCRIWWRVLIVLCLFWILLVVVLV